MHQLIILGNGFDLACGLKSKFSHFFGNRTNGTFSYESIPEDERNIWDFILAEVGEGDPLWCDIESLISAYVFRDGKASSKIDSMYHPRARAFNPWGPNKPFHPESELYKFAVQLIGKNDISQRELTSYLLSELKHYEHSFGCYLNEQVMQSATYANDAKRYFAAIRDSCLTDSEQPLTTSSILNFNYTVPFGADNYRLGIEAVRNVHGVLGATETIFGIDGKDVPEDDPALPFTKTYRLLSLENHRKAQIIKLGDNGTNLIKVFGHSLAKADYSYFQSIFDSVNLYGGNTTLVFLYKVFSNKLNESIDEQDIRENLYSRISHLLIEYGATLDNKDHGKNHMHKLLLEQRLIIERIDNPSEMPSSIYLH